MYVFDIYIIHLLVEYFTWISIKNAVHEHESIKLPTQDGFGHNSNTTTCIAFMVDIEQKVWYICMYQNFMALLLLHSIWANSYEYVLVVIWTKSQSFFMGFSNKMLSGWPHGAICWHQSTRIKGCTLLGKGQLQPRFLPFIDEKASLSTMDMIIKDIFL